MKVLLRERVAEIISTMEQACSYLRTLHRKEDAGELLVTCQETAVSLGSILEHNEQPDRISALMGHLENYHELAYQMYICGTEEWRSLTEQIEAEVSAMKSCFHRDIPEELMKAVFLPYNASMWDTFQSVYDAAKKDRRFEVWVLPIPYYNLSAQRAIQKVHYEGAEIAKYVPITDYRKYDLQAEQPDLIFIHNPYDQYNHVTQVHEDYFSSKLLQYTPRLVYIPYYVSKDLTAEYMIRLPGVLNAWRIFVEKEAIRKQYIKAGIPASKVAALGSPKYDMLTRYAAEKEIPEEWFALQGKRVFFYNTHLNDIINNGEVFLQKIRHVMSVFEKRDDVALLWRPHPLSIETIQAMAPQLLTDYLKLVERIKSGSFGVYDDTADLNRTIAISDAYIGEEQSSVSQLYEATGKPMFYIRNYNPDFVRPERYARCLCAELVDGKAYMYSWEYNLILIHDASTGEIRVEKGNENYPGNEQILYTQSSVLDGEKIYFLPGSAAEVMRYDTATGEQKLIGLGKETGPCNAVLWEEWLYLFPIYASDDFWTIHRETGEVECFPTNYGRDIQGLEKIGRKPLFSGSVLARGCLWRVCRFGPYMQRFDMKRNVFEYVQIAGCEGSLYGLAFDGKFFWWICLFGSRIFQWDPEKNKIVRIITIEGFESRQEEMLLYRINFCNGRIWVIPRKGSCITCIEAETGIAEQLDFGEIPGLRCDQSYTEAFYHACLKGDDLWLFPHHANGILKINTNTREMTFQETALPSQAILGAVSGMVASESLCEVEAFLEWSQQKMDIRMDEQREPVGGKIWDDILGHMYA